MVPTLHNEHHLARISSEEYDQDDSGAEEPPISRWLKHLNLHSLERRRVRGDLIEVFKWVIGYNKGDISKVMRISQHEGTRSNGFKLEKYRFRREIGKHWFSYRVGGWGNGIN